MKRIYWLVLAFLFLGLAFFLPLQYGEKEIPIWVFGVVLFTAIATNFVHIFIKEEDK